MTSFHPRSKDSAPPCRTLPGLGLSRIVRHASLSAADLPAAGAKSFMGLRPLAGTKYGTCQDAASDLRLNP